MPISFVVYQMRSAMEHDLVVSLYTDMNDPDAYCSGYIEQVNAKHVLLSALTPWGHRDGWLLWRVSDVQQVYMGDEEETRLELLARLYGEDRAPLTHKPASPESDLSHWVLDWAKRERRTISLLTSSRTYTGRVKARDDLRVTLDAFDFFGRIQQPPVVRPLREVESISIGTEYERMYDFLHASRDKIDLPQTWWNKEPT